MEQTHVITADITTLALDAIVNAANESLLGGGGVDGAIHRAAGPGLLEECRRIGGCQTGNAVITSGHGLPAQHVIHTVGPVYDDGRSGEPDLLRSCYREVLGLVSRHAIRSVAFPCISTGVYSYPSADAADIAISEVRAWLAEGGRADVTFCCFSDADADLYRERL